MLSQFSLVTRAIIKLGRNLSKVFTPGPGERARVRHSSGGVTERAFLAPAPHQAEDCSPLELPVTAMSVKADIHCHTVNSPGTNLPDLLPR